MKKESTASKKTSKKTTKSYKVIVDLTKAETPADVYDAFIDAKVAAGIPISRVEMIIAKAHLIDIMFDVIDDIATDIDKKTTCINDDKLAKDMLKMIKKHMTKKDPWYKRAWKWVKKPFTRKK